MIHRILVAVLFLVSGTQGKGGPRPRGDLWSAIPVNFPTTQDADREHEREVEVERADQVQGLACGHDAS